MQLGCPISAVAAALYSAVHVDLKPVEYRQWTPTMKSQGIKSEEAPLVERRPYTYEVSVFAMFPQTWSDTSLGFGGVAGQSITPAYTVIIEGGRGEYCVYFGGQFAYRIEKPAVKFFEDVAAQRMVPVKDRWMYERP